MFDPLGNRKTLGQLTYEERSAYYLNLEKELEGHNQNEIKAFWSSDPNRKLYEAQETVLAYIQKENNTLIPASGVESQKDLVNDLLAIMYDFTHSVKNLMKIMEMIEARYLEEY